MFVHKCTYSYDNFVITSYLLVFVWAVYNFMENASFCSDFKGNPLAQDIMNLYQEPDGTRRLLNYLLDNLAGTKRGKLGFLFSVEGHGFL